MKKIQILIADDHKVFREGIVSILNQTERMNIIGQASDVQGILEQLKQGQPDVILMDITLKDSSGIEATKIVVKQYPNIKVLMLSMHSESHYIINALDAGAVGYLLKDAGTQEMMTAIQTVFNGDTYYSKQVSDILVQHLTRKTPLKKSKQDIPLTPRETEILKLIAEEFSNPEIAQKLFISIRTVDTHRRNLLEKLQVKNTAGLVKYAIKNGII